MAHVSNSGGAIRRYIDRLEKLAEDKQEVNDQIKDVMKEAKLEGFDTKAIREVLRIRKMEPEERQIREFNVAAYRTALGELANLPLGESAIERAETLVKAGVLERGPAR